MNMNVGMDAGGVSTLPIESAVTLSSAIRGISGMSSPAQKVFPAPVMTSTRVSRSNFTSRIASCSCFCSEIVSALCLLGRFSVMRVTSPFFSKIRSVYLDMSAPWLG